MCFVHLLLDPKPESLIQRVMLETRFVRVAGRRIYPTYTATTEDGIKVALRLDGSDPGIFREIFRLRPYEKHFSPLRGQTVVDVGANIGCFALRAAKLVGNSGNVVAFEPSESNFRLLQRNLHLNRCMNVLAYSAALGDKKGNAELKIYDHEDRDTILPDRANEGKRVKIGSRQVEVWVMDDVVQSLSLARVDLIKLDAEGYELPIIKGATWTLNKFHPKIVGEAHPEFSDSAELMMTFLQGYGYEGVVEPFKGKTQLFFAWPSADR
jgi:FkbM family methyltransferase